MTFSKQIFSIFSAERQHLGAENQTNYLNKLGKWVNFQRHLLKTKQRPEIFRKLLFGGNFELNFEKVYGNAIIGFVRISEEIRKSLSQNPKLIIGL